MVSPSVFHLYGLFPDTLQFSKNSSTLSKSNIPLLSAATSSRKMKYIATSIDLPIAAPRAKSLRSYKLITKHASKNTDLQIATSSEVNPNTHLDPVLPLVNSLQGDND